MILRNRSICAPVTRFSMGLALTLGLILLSSIPFVHALQIHHLFADIDHDGHQHSDFDLCQWTQHHTGSSLIWDAPIVFHRAIVTALLSLDRGEVPLSFARSLFNPRGPPTLFFS